jgi:predicted ATP-grasp superfamily ATP-dependent carboligase
MSESAEQLNPARAERGWPAAVVAGAYQTAIVLMRNLSRRGVKTACLDCTPSQPGFKTVYGKAHLCPHPDDAPEAWLRFMLDLAATYDQPPVLIPSSDQFVSAIARHANELQGKFIFLRDSMATQELLATKKRQYDIASSHGLPTPRTRFITSLSELREFAAEARFPCLIKPVHFRHWCRLPAAHPLFDQKTAIVKSPAEMEATYHSVQAVTPEVVLQEIIEGPDTAKLVYLSCYSQRGERLAGCVLRQIRCSPIHMGSASICAPVDDPETDKTCDAFLRSIGYGGLCELELKRDTRDGIVKLIEANPRYSITSDAGPYVGLDIGWLHYLDLIGQPVKPVAPLPRWNFRHIVLRRDFNTFRSYIDAGMLTWPEWIASYKPPVAFFDFDLRDWRVTWDTIVELLKILFGPSYRRWRPKKRA